MKIVIFSGTTEGRRLSGELAEAGAEVTVCVASDYGREEQGKLPGVQVRVGPLSPEEKRELLQGAALCVDATHPYARHIRESVKAACEAENTPLLRLKRPDSELGDAHAVESSAEAAAYLARLFPRILPSMESIAACEEMGIPHRNIIAMQGPFSKEMNTATIRQYAIRFLVSKDGGEAGGFAEKAAAAKETGTELIVLRRPEENGLSFDEVLNRCMTRLRVEI